MNIFFMIFKFLLKFSFYKFLIISIHLSLFLASIYSENMIQIESSAVKNKKQNLESKNESDNASVNEHEKEKTVDPNIRFQVAFYITLVTLTVVFLSVFKIREIEKSEYDHYKYKKYKNKINSDSEKI